MAALAVIYFVIVYAVPRPEAIRPEGWRLLGLFAATVAGLALEPLPGGALVFIAVVLSSAICGLTLRQSLSGYADPTVWLLLAAFFIARSLIHTGLARRIGLFFVRLFGKSSIGIYYALSMSEMTLATVIPSNGARSGGVIMPIARSIAEVYGSEPGPTAALLGSFLMTAVYQSDCVAAAMFYTGQAGNPLAAKLAPASMGHIVTWSSWFAAGIVPGLCSLAVIPWVVLWLNPPTIRKTPEAHAFASRELEAMGPMSRREWILAVVFASVCGLWVTSGWTHLNITWTALCGGAALILTGVLSWEEIKGDKAAWDLFIWFGGLVMLGKALNDAKVTTEFARIVAGAFGGTGWVWLLAAALLIYFYAHYAFASITAHLLAMYPPFLVVLLAKGAPPGLVIFSFACFANLSAGLTHYGTTPAPMYFAQGYVSLRKWWTVGLVVSFVNLAIWSVIGFSWWKLIGIW